jgi:glycosyltransferase involved in cell wall biosynthesis
MPKRNDGLETDADARRAVFLAPEAPYPVAGGGALRAASLFTYLARRYRVDVILFREPGTDPAKQFPAGLAENIHVIDLPANARHFPAKVLRNSGRLLRRVPPLVDRFAGFSDRIAEIVHGRAYSLAVVEHSWCAAYGEQLAPVSARLVLDLHNIESALHRRCGQTEPWPTSLAHRVFARASGRLERRYLPRFSDLLVTSPAEEALVREICPRARVIVYPNALPLLPCPAARERHTIVFSGNLEYHPNISAVRFFRREIWPRLRRRWPGLVWRVVGKNPQGVRGFTQGDDRIELSGPIDDAVGELATAKVAVAPLVAASGTRLKIMEAWAAARPVVSTPLGAEGLPVRHGENILLAESPAAFADAVSALLDSPALRRRLGRAGRELYEREFTWEKAWSHLDL